MLRSGRSLDETGHDSLQERFRDSLTFDLNKPSSVSSSSARGSATVFSSSSSGSSSSGSISGKTSTSKFVNGSEATTKSHSGEFPRSSESSRSVAATRKLDGHRRSKSTGPPLIFSGGSFGTSSNGTPHTAASNSTSNLLPSGNICPSGKILKTGMAHGSTGKTEVLGMGTGQYGHGNVMRSGAGKLPSLVDPIPVAGESATGKTGLCNSDPEKLKKAGNEQYKRGNFAGALSFYDRAIALLPENAAYRSNRAAALTALGKLGEAVKECEGAVRLSPGYGRAHQRLATLYLRMGQVENARRHLSVPGLDTDPAEWQKLHYLERRLNRCADARKICDWNSALKECDAALAAGADCCPQLLAFKAETLLKLHKLGEADSILSNLTKLEPLLHRCTQVKLFGMHSEAYVLYVKAQVDMAMGRFENGVVAVEKAALFDYTNIEVAVLLNNLKLVSRARSRGNDFFSFGKYTEACLAYEEGLTNGCSNPILYCNRAVCWSKLGLWERSVDDCSKALKMQPNYIKALHRRAVSNEKLGRWEAAVRDYEVLKRELPGDSEVAESLFHAQVAMKKPLGEAHGMKFDGEVEVSGFDRLKAEISSPGAFVVHFRAASNRQCEELSSFISILCSRYPSVSFLKVDVERIPAVASAEHISVVPTIKMYKNGGMVKVIVCPSHEFLESCVRHCCV